MIISNVELAKLAHMKNPEINVRKMVEELDIGRTEEQEEQEEYTIDEVIKMVESICISHEIDKEEMLI